MSGGFNAGSMRVLTEETAMCRIKNTIRARAEEGHYDCKLGSATINEKQAAELRAAGFVVTFNMPNGYCWISW